MGRSQERGLSRRKKHPPEHKAQELAVCIPEGIKAAIETIIPESCIDAAKGQKMGRPTKYCPATVRTFFHNIVRGLPVQAAATVSGVTPQAVAKWSKAYPDLVDGIARARELSQHHLMSHVEAGFTKHPKLALDVLERRHPKDWAPVKNINSNVLQATIQLEPDRLASMQGRSDCVSDVNELIAMGKRSESTACEDGEIIEAELAPETEDKCTDGDGI